VLGSGVGRRLRTSHTLRLIDAYRARIDNEKRKFVIASGLLLSSAISSLKRLGIVPFILTGILLNFLAVQLLALLILGFLIIKLNSYRIVNGILRLVAF
jgi:hypothetical protein